MANLTSSFSHNDLVLTLVKLNTLIFAPLSCENMERNENNETDGIRE